MAKQLVPKAKRIPKPVETIWDELEKHGYRPLPSSGKQPKITGWPTAPTDAKARQTWPVKYGAGITTEGELFGFDIDTKREEDLKAVLWAAAAIAPGFVAHAVRRHSGAHSLMLFGRCRTPFKYAATHAYGESEQAEKLAQVEALLGAGVRHIAVWGPHPKHTPDAPRAYGYHGPELWTVRVEDLPEVTEAQLFAMLDAADRVFAERLVMLAGSKLTIGDREQVWDLVPGMIFDQADGGPIEVTVLEAELWQGEQRRGSGSIFTPSSDNPTVCVATLGRTGLVIVDFHGAGTTHRWASAKPKDAPDLTALKALQGLHGKPQGEGGDGGGGGGGASGYGDGDEPPPPGDDASSNERTQWLLKTRAYCETDDEVIRLYEPSDVCRSKLSAFRMRYKAWFEDMRVGPRSTKRVFATEVWEIAPQRPNVAGVRMNPEQAFPTYMVGNKLFKNTYRRPPHAATGGDVAAFLAFMEIFIPDRIQREWMLDWMAHKQWKPWIPGSAVILVADTEDGVREGKFGVGRGQFFRIAHLLYGEEYARPQDFEVVDGTSGQSDYTDWLHASVLATIDESKSSATAHRRGERNATYEVLKKIVDPAPKRRDFKTKYGKSFNGWSYCSIWLASNHADALAIPKGDRRFTVLTNGRVMTPEEARALAAWITPENVAALSQWLAKRDLSQFDMMRHLQTKAKDEMAELAVSNVEGILRDLMEDETFGLVFTRSQLEKTVENIVDAPGSHWRGEFAAAWPTFVSPVKTQGGNTRRIRISTKLHKLFCFRDRRARAEALPEAALRREAGKSGFVDGFSAHIAGHGAPDEDTGNRV